MEVSVKSSSGAAAGTINLDDRVFGIEPNRAVLHQAVVAYQANMRQGTAATKTRGMVQSSGKKPWRQKGTGRARQGMVSAPHWRGGGVVDRFDVGEGRTKALIAALAAFGVEGRTVIVVPEADVAVRRASGNLQNVRVVIPNGLNLLEILQAGAVVLYRDAVEPLTGLLLGEVAEAAAA
jgi:large subunit ribosomal protein L4